ncbi:hypothetical protein MHU86_11914 [Fragilaria crotonensis]|nr:hypothetical protein MHU86_11914 [Fragilaria crotonensis]
MLAKITTMTVADTHVYCTSGANRREEGEKAHNHHLETFPKRSSLAPVAMAKLSALFWLAALSGADANDRYLRKYSRTTGNSTVPQVNGTIPFVVREVTRPPTRPPVQATSKSPAVTSKPTRQPVQVPSKSPAVTAKPTRQPVQGTKSPTSSGTGKDATQPASRSPAATIRPTHSPVLETSESPEASKSPAATRKPSSQPVPEGTRSPIQTATSRPTRQPVQRTSESPEASKSPATTRKPTSQPVPEASKSPATSKSSSDVIVNQAAPTDLPPPEAGFVQPKMETVPFDVVDTVPQNTGGFDLPAQSTAEIPEMERIPDHLVDQVDIVDTPSSSDSAVALPFGSSAENFVLERTASVCATSQEGAFKQCAAWPVCKYVLDAVGNPTTTIKPNQGKCILDVTRH